MQIIIKVSICNQLESNIFKIIIKDLENNLLINTYTNKYGIYIFNKDKKDIYIFEIIPLTNLYPKKIKGLIYNQNINISFYKLHKINLILTDYNYHGLPIKKGEISLG